MPVGRMAPNRARRIRPHYHQNMVLPRSSMVARPAVPGANRNPAPPRPACPAAGLVPPSVGTGRRSSPVPSPQCPPAVCCEELRAASSAGVLGRRGVEPRHRNRPSHSTARGAPVTTAPSFWCIPFLQVYRKIFLPAPSREVRCRPDRSARRVTIRQTTRSTAAECDDHVAAPVVPVPWCTAHQQIPRILLTRRPETPSRPGTEGSPVLNTNTKRY